MGPGCTFPSGEALVRKQAVVGEKAVDPVNGLGKVMWAAKLAVNLGPSVLMSPTLSEQAMAQAQSSQIALRLDWLLQVGGPGKLAKAYGLGPGRSRAAVCPTGMLQPAWPSQLRRVCQTLYAPGWWPLPS